MTTPAPSLRGLALAPELARLTSASRVSTTLPDRIAYARDLWPRGLLGVRAGDLAPLPPDAVVWPETVEEVQAIVRYAARAGDGKPLPIVPFGAGSGVCGGTLPVEGGLVVDCKRMRRLIALDEENLTATFEAGIVGEHLEHELVRRGYTLGHFPSSIMCSTLGGWLAARSAGQCSTRYGKIEDLVRSVEFVDGQGEVIRTSDPHLMQLFVGSEGTLGIFTRAELAIRPLAHERRMRGFTFPSVSAGCEAMRRVMQAGLHPFVLRLYDELDTFVAKRSARKSEAGLVEGASLTEWLSSVGGSDVARLLPQLRKRLTALALGQTGIANRLVDLVMPRLSGGCLLVVGVEGDRALVDGEWRAVERELVAAGGQDAGAAPGERWLANRYAISFGMSKVFDAGAFVDTMEVAVSWDHLLELYHSVRTAVAPHAFVMAHFSHAYAEGCSIYFTYAASAPTRAAAEERYDTIWRAGLAAATAAGATISHHHGVGLLKARFMADEHGQAMRLLSSVKRALDPAGVMNPGKLGIERVAARTTRSDDASASVAPSPTPGDAVLHLDERSRLVHVQAGITLGALRAHLAPQGLHLGAFPVACDARTIGAALSAPEPRERTPRGTLLDCCAALDVTLPDGTELHTRLAPRKATGPDLMHATLGARGAAGTIVGAWLRLEHLPTDVRSAAWTFSDDAQAITVARGLLDRGVRPSLLRVQERTLVVELDAAPELAEAELVLCEALAVDAGATRLASVPPPATPVGAALAMTSDRGRFVPMRELAAAWASRPAGTWLSSLAPAGACLVADPRPAPLDEPARALRAAITQQIVADARPPSGIAPPVTLEKEAP